MKLIIAITKIVGGARGADPAYEDASLNLEADKRHSQKRVSVKLEDL